MRTFLVVIFILAAFVGYLWYLGDPAKAPAPASRDADAQAVDTSEPPSTFETVIDESPFTAEAEEPEDEPAQEGSVFFLNEPVFVQSSSGVLRLPAGARLTQVGSSGSALVLTDGERTVQVERSRVSTDLPTAMARSRASDAMEGASTEARMQDVQRRMKILEAQIKSESEKIKRTEQGGLGGSLTSAPQSLSGGAMYAIEESRGRIANWNSELDGLKQHLADLQPPEPSPESSPEPSSGLVQSTPSLEPIAIEPEPDRSGFGHRIAIGLTRLLAKLRS